MRIKKNIVIFGPSRSGKTTLAIKLAKKLKYSVIMADPIVTAFEETFPDLEITHNNRDGKTVEKLEPFLIRYVATTGSSSKAKRGLHYIYEGSYFRFEQLQTHMFKKRFIVIYLCSPMDSVEDYYNQLKTYDKEYDWTYRLTDDAIRDYCKNLKQANDYFKTLFEDNGIKYYDTSKNRNKVINKIIKITKKQIKKDMYEKN